jgi:putative FmdB family regulatory protein
MPTYEYHCNACHREFEYQQKMSDADLVRCEACGEDKLERLISWTSVRAAPGMRKVHYSADRMEGAPRADSSRSQRFTGAGPAEPPAEARAGAAATSGTDSGTGDTGSGTGGTGSGGTDSGTGGTGSGTGGTGSGGTDSATGGT